MPELIEIEELVASISAGLDHAFSIRVADLKKSISMTEDLMTQSMEAGLGELAHRAKNHLGLYHLIQGKFEQAEKNSLEALRFFESIGNLKGVADARYNLGGIYYRTNKFHQSLLLLVECLKTYRDLEDYYDQARTLKSMGTVYEFFSDWDKAVESYEKSVEACRKIGNLGLESNALNPLSAIYFKQGKPELAFQTIERSLLLKRETGDKRGLAFALYGRGKLKMKVGQFKAAIPDLEESIIILEEAGDQIGLAMAYNKMGASYMALDQLKEARKFLQTAHDLSIHFKIEVMHFRVEYNLYLLCKREGNHLEALDRLEKFLKCKEAVINKESYSVIKTYDAVSRIEDLEREARLQIEKNQIIETKNAELDSFFYRVSHDLKGPISTLQGLYNLVKLEVKNEQALGYFDMYHAQVSRIHNIVISLIDLTQMRHMEVGRVPIDFQALVDDCISSCNYLEHFKQIRFIRSIEDLQYSSEWAIINTILQNLIENAVKYSRSHDPFVKISIYHKTEKIWIEVEDNGMGIDSIHQAKIFDMFYRASERSKGSGLGLYILKRAVERLNGEITVTSEPNHGSAFVVTLPI